MSAVKNIMTVDVEDYFQVSAFESIIERDNWNNISCRVYENTSKIIEQITEYNSDAGKKAQEICQQIKPKLIYNNCLL